MSIVAKFIFWTSIITVIYTWAGYYLLLIALTKINKIRKESFACNENSFYFPISIIVTASNEELVIGKRIDDLMEQDYPKDKLEIIIASDGSTDRTVEISKQYANHGVKVLEFQRKRGRGAVQNDAIKTANGDILIFTDAETRFEKDCVKEMVKYFSDSSIGCVVGSLAYTVKKGSSVSESEGLYWDFEKKLRKMENNFGILATATGACMAVRKNLWNQLGAIDDCDFTTPLDVILQGFKIILAAEAIAYDVPAFSAKGELKVRIRQTSTNFVGTLKRWGWIGMIKYPGISWGLLSHKVFRWLTPFFMLGLFLGNFFLLHNNVFYAIVFIFQILFYLMGIIGFIGELMKKKIPFGSLVFSFCVANIGMGIGVIKGVLGQAPSSYGKEE
jgi:cellulose synthase/poly-beta-1,6-N-acetylglucosamine synthase-like glycosyltransferase